MVSLQSFPGPLTSSPLPSKMLPLSHVNYVTSHLRPFRKKKKKKRPFSSFHCSWENIPIGPVWCSLADLPCSLAIILSCTLGALPTLAFFQSLLHWYFLLATGLCTYPMPRILQVSTPVPLLSKWHELYATGVLQDSSIWGMGRI